MGHDEGQSVWSDISWLASKSAVDTVVTGSAQLVMRVQFKFGASSLIL